MLDHFFDISLFEFLGLTGVALYLFSYAALQFNLIEARGFYYPFLNFLAASFVLISLFENFNMPSLLIQLSWITISLYGISRLLVVRQTKRSSSMRRA